MFKDLLNKITTPSESSGKWVNGRFVQEKKVPTQPFSPEWTTPPQPQDVSNNINGINAEKNDDTEEAIRLYEQNVAARFDGSHPYKRLAIIYRKQKRYADEVRVLEVAVDVFSKLKRQDAPKKLEYFQERLKKARELNGKG